MLSPARGHPSVHEHPVWPHTGTWGHSPHAHTAHTYSLSTVPARRTVPARFAMPCHRTKSPSCARSPRRARALCHPRPPRVPGHRAVPEQRVTPGHCAIRGHCAMPGHHVPPCHLPPLAWHGVAHVPVPSPLCPALSCLHGHPMGLVPPSRCATLSYPSVTPCLVPLCHPVPSQCDVLSCPSVPPYPIPL